MGLKSKLWPPSSCRIAEKVKDTQLDLNFRSMTSYWVLLFSCSDVSDSLQPHELQHARLLCPHRLPKFAHTYVHWVGDAIQPFILHCPLLLPSIFPSISVFSNESTLHLKWPMYWSFSFSISLSSEYSGLTSFTIDWLDLLAIQGTLQSLLPSTTIQKHQFCGAQPSWWSSSHVPTWLPEKT